MADNFLEKRMEDYRKGNLNTTYRKRVASTGNQAASATYNICSRAIVAVADIAIREAIVERLIAAGCRTSFLATDRRSSTAFAQRSGSLFCPISLPTAGSIDSQGSNTDSQPNRDVALKKSPVEVLTEGFCKVRDRWEGLDIIVTDREDFCIKGTQRVLLLPYATPSDHAEPTATTEIIYCESTPEQISAASIAAIVAEAKLIVLK